MTTLSISRQLLAEIVTHCREVYPCEACGILAGKNNVVQKIYRMTNIEKSGVSYFMDPKEQFAVMKEMREEGLEMTAVYHSHPHADACPSQKDVSLAFYDDAYYLIVSLIHESPLIKAFTIKEGMVKEVEIVT